jgi:hypothetical protein
MPRVNSACPLTRSGAAYARPARRRAASGPRRKGSCGGRRLCSRFAQAHSDALIEALPLVERLQHEVVARTEAATLWQARAEFLANQVERLQFALDAQSPIARKSLYNAILRGWYLRWPRKD